MSLIRSYFLALVRSARRDLNFSILNLLGLAFGLTAVLLIFFYIQNQLGYERHNENLDRIYRVEGDFFINENQDLTALTQIPIGPTLKDEFPEIEEQVRLLPDRDQFYKKGEDVFREDSIVFGDSTLLKVFSLELLYGDPETALNEPNTMIISQSMSKKYFGTDNASGERMENLEGNAFTITGIFRDLPGNVHLRYNGVISAATIEERIGGERFNDRSSGSFWNVNCYTFVLMAEHTEPQMVYDKFDAFYDTYMAELGDQINAGFNLRLTPLADIHFQKDELTWDQPKGNMNYVYILGAIAVLLVIIASINYTNLTTARAASRSKEIGVRKVGGASRASLRQQFLGESIAMGLLAGLIATLLSIPLMGVFNEVAGTSLNTHDLFQWRVILFILGLSILTGLLSGLYPSIYLSSFNPVSILKGNGVSSRDRGWLRTTLVIAQFMISGLMIIGSLVISMQMRYIQNKDLGFDKEQVLLLTMNDTALINNLDAFREEIRRSPAIEECAISSHIPGGFYSLQVMTLEDMNGEMQEKAISQCFVNHEYMDVMGLELVAGRFYSREFGSDVEMTAFVVNEALVEQMQWGDEAIGKQFIRGVNIQGANNPLGEVVGVVRDYNFGSLHNKVDPLVIVCLEQPQFMRTLHVRFSPGQHAEALDWVLEKRNEFNPSHPVQYSYLSEDLREMYEEEKIIFSLVLAFTGLIIFIAALGLLGLSAFMTLKRTRETGIRRVMGASQNQILLLFLNQFSKWVLLSNLLAWPLSWWIMQNWLENFNYRINFPFWTFVLSLCISLVIAISTVSWQSLKASRTNPAEAIRAD